MALIVLRPRRAVKGRTRRVGRVDAQPRVGAGRGRPARRAPAATNGRPVEPKLYPVIVDGITVDLQPLCWVYYNEPYVDCATAYYYFEPQGPG